MNPELALYEALGKEILRRVMAEEDPTSMHQWLQEQITRLGGGADDENAVMTWEESFEFYEKLLEKRAAEAMIPEGERKVIDWPWASWNRFIDPLEPGLLAVLSAGDGMGKCLGKGTRVVMYDGTLRSVEDVKVGDLLMGPDSTPRRVLALGRGREQMYWIRQNKGVHYRCNASHLLALMVRDKRNRKTEQIIEARQVAAMPDWYIQRHLQGYKVGVDWPEQEVELDPYFLGLWLGDGNKRNGMIFASDPEVISWLESYAGRLGSGVTVKPDNEHGSVMRVLISNGRGGLHVRRGNTPAWRLSEMGLIENKHIPQKYITNTQAVRLALLAGLIDSDGYFDKSAKSYEITQKDEALARQIKFVADSLGFSTTLSPKRATIKEREVDTQVWRLTIRGDLERIPVLIPRKRAEQRVINKDWRVTGFAIEPDGEDDYYGFTLDGDHRFLLEDMTVTHNTIYAEQLAEHWARKQNRVVFVHYELNRAIMLDRRTARHTSIPRRVLKSGLLDAEQTRRVADVRPRLLAWDGYITYLHTPGWSIDRTLAELRRLKAEGHCDVVVLDYLEKNAPSERQRKLFGQNIYQREADNVEQIKNFAESTETSVLMLTQMNKQGKSSGFDQIDRTGMRGAGEKSEKANIVVLLHRERDEQDGYSNTVDVRIDKNTVGRTGNLKQYMEPEYFRVADFDTDPLGRPVQR